jgi:hypothetical protein
MELRAAVSCFGPEGSEGGKRASAKGVTLSTWEAFEAKVESPTEELEVFHPTTPLAGLGH